MCPPELAARLRWPGLPTLGVNSQLPEEISDRTISCSIRCCLRPTAITPHSPCRGTPTRRVVWGSERCLCWALNRAARFTTLTAAVSRCHTEAEASHRQLSGLPWGPLTVSGTQRSTPTRYGLATPEPNDGIPRRWFPTEFTQPVVFCRDHNDRARPRA